MTELDDLWSRYRYEYVSPVIYFGPITTGTVWELDFILANRGWADGDGVNRPAERARQRACRAPSLRAACAKHVPRDVPNRRQQPTTATSSNP
jgi:hypothetical protein